MGDFAIGDSENVFRQRPSRFEDGDIYVCHGENRMYWSDLNHTTYPSPDEICLFEGNRTASRGECLRGRAEEDLVSFYETAGAYVGVGADDFAGLRGTLDPDPGYYRNGFEAMEVRLLLEPREVGNETVFFPTESLLDRHIEGFSPSYEC